MIQAEQLHARILEELDLSRDIPDEELTELIHRVLDEASGREYIPLGKKAELGRELFNAFRKFDLLQEFLEDDKITEIMINGTDQIREKVCFTGEAGRCHSTDRCRIQSNRK